MEAIDQYPKYRQQSLEIQQHLEGEIQELRKSQQENTRRLVEMEETSKRRELNKLRDRLIESYQYYTNPKGIQSYAGHGWKPKHSGGCSKIMRKTVEMATFILWCSRQ